MINDSRKLEDFIERYELDRRQGRMLSLGAFVPPHGHPQRRETIVELVRVDMEYSWAEGQGNRVEDYQALFPDDLHGGECLEQVAFEEYRLRRLAGERVTRREYGERYSISTDSWMEVPVGVDGQGPSTLRLEESSIRLLSQVHPELAHRLADAARQMPSVGDRFENFELVGELGSGAFGCVFLARQNDLARRFVALKITSHVTDEPRQLAQLQHTHIVPIYSVHRQGALQAICMPFLGPTTLANVLHSFADTRAIPVSGQAFVTTLTAHANATNDWRTVAEKPLLGAQVDADAPEVARPAAPNCPAARVRLGTMSYVHAVVWIMARVADGMAFAHEHGVVHCDLKPANILLTEDGEPLILDFNLAQQSYAEATAVALIGGTLPYMAPEHLAALRTGIRVEPVSDVYALGVILFQLLTGRLPSQVCDWNHVEESAAARDRLLTGTLRRLNPAVSPGLAAIVARCLATDVAERYPSGRELHDDLQRHHTNRPLRFAADRSWRERLQKWSRRHSQLASLTSVATISALVIGTLIVALWTRSSLLAANRARDSLRMLDDQLNTARTMLNSPLVDPGELTSAVQSTADALQLAGVMQQDDWAERGDNRFLSAPESEHLSHVGGELLYLFAGGKARQATRAVSAADRKRLWEESLQANALAGRATGAEDTLPSVLAQRARFLRAIQRTKEAEALESQLSSLSERGTDHRQRAYELTEQHQYQEAVRLLRAAVDDAPRDFTLWFSLGNAYLNLQRFDEAEGCFTSSLALKPRFTLGLQHRGFARLNAGKYAAARADLDQVVQAWPVNCVARINRALACESLGLLQEAEQDLTRALLDGCRETRVFFLRGQIRDRLGDRDGAAADFRDGLRKTPCDELSWIARGVARRKDDPQAALSDLQKSLELNPRSVIAWQNMAHVQAECLQDLPAAILALDRVLSLQPENADALAGRGVLHARSGHRDAALGDARRALDVSSDAEVIYQVAGIHALLAPEDKLQQDEAVRLLAQALFAKPTLARDVDTDIDLANIRPLPAVQSLLSAVAVLETSATGL